MTRLVKLRAATIIKLLTEANLGDLTLLAAISAHTHCGTCCASVPTLGEFLGIHERTARKRMKVLTDLHFVRQQSVHRLERAEREIVDASGPMVQIEVAGVDMDDAFGLLLLLMALGLPYTGELNYLARMAGVSRPTLNGLLDRLIEQNLLTLQRKTRSQFLVVPAGTPSGTLGAGGSRKKSAEVLSAYPPSDKWARIAARLRAQMRLQEAP